MWTLETALEWVREYEPRAAAAGFHLALTGSCLYRGESAKDLDIVVYPHNAKELFDWGILDSILDLDLFYPDRPDALGSCPQFDKFIIVYKDKQGRRIDLFMLK